jgi:hypothetical protein
MHTYRSISLVAFVVVCASACGGGGELKPPPPPLRPKPIDVDRPRQAQAKDDCEVTDPADEDPAKTFQQRSVPEAEKLAQTGLANLKAAIGKDIDQSTRESLITDSVDLFVTALLADPYNVTATYHLAGAYGRIGRVQCSINLLKRMLQMKDHASHKDDVEDKLDQLLGRNKQPLDPDFNDMRDDVRFRTLIERMCERDKDKDCVLGEGGKP